MTPLNTVGFKEGEIISSSKKIQLKNVCLFVLGKYGCTPHSIQMLRDSNLIHYINLPSEEGIS